MGNDKNTDNQKIGCAVVVGLFILLFLFMYMRNTGTSNQVVSTERTQPKINAKVQFDGKQFVITNLDTFDWSDVKLELNDTFTLTAAVIRANSTYTVGAMQFSDTRGTRFNPFTMKARELSICANTANGLACYVGGWE
jgi:hypothetical protein